MTETKMKLSTLQQNYDKQSSTLSTIEGEISTLEKSFETCSEKKSNLERQLQQIKTRSKVIADFYTDRDLKFHTRLGVENQARSFSENELQAMEQKEQLKKDEIEEYRKQVFELKEQISKQDRDHAERLQSLKRAEHADWILHKEMEKELRMKRFELEQMKQKISELEEQVIVVRNAACLGAPSSKPSLADVYLDLNDPSLAGLDLSTAPKPPTPPNIQADYMNYPHQNFPTDNYQQPYPSGYPQTTVFQQYSPQNPYPPQEMYSPNNTQSSTEFQDYNQQSSHYPYQGHA